jgi:hypothetical protein
MDINIVFTIPAEYRAPMKDMAELALGAERAVFEKLKNPCTHMNPLFIRGHLDGTLVGHMLVDGAQVSTSCRCHCSKSSATLRVILNVQILALVVLQVILQKPSE